MRDGLPLPQRIQNAPSLAFGMQLYYGAFFELSTCRQASMSLGPIPWTAIKDYAIAHELDEEQTEDLFHFVRVLDNEYLRRENAKARSKTGGK